MSLTSGEKLHIHLLNMVVRFIVFLTSATRIFRGTDISKCFRESLGIRDNESRLYIYIVCVLLRFRASKTGLRPPPAPTPITSNFPTDRPKAVPLLWLCFDNALAV